VASQCVGIADSLSDFFVVFIVAVTGLSPDSVPSWWEAKLLER
jgi:hypothetical protein